MTKITKDILNKIEIKLNNGWRFQSELHRPHHKYVRESFKNNVITKTTRELNNKHIHLSLFNIQWNVHTYDNICKKINAINLHNKYYGTNKKIPSEYILVYGLNLFPVNDLKDGLLYNFIKNLLFPINLKKAITLLNYEGNELFRTLSQIIVLKKINEDILNESRKI